MLWASFFRRQGRVLRRTLSEIDLAVIICTSILLGVIVISTLVFLFGTKNDNVAGAFYRTISLMATGADMDGRRL